MKWFCICMQFFLLFYVCSPSSLHTMSPDKSYSSFAPENTLFLWDLHDVLLEATLFERMMSALSFRCFPTLLKHITPSFMWDACALTFNQLRYGLNTDGWLKLAEKHKNHSLEAFINKVGNTQRIIPEVAHIIRQLKLQGYEHHIASNIGHAMFEDLRDERKYPREHAYLFTHFSRDNLKRIIAHTVVHNFKEPRHTFKKPHPAFFYDYVQTFRNSIGRKRIIFIDNDETNVKAAQRCGLYGIHYTSADKLKKDLEHLGIIIHPSLPASLSSDS